MNLKFIFQPGISVKTSSTNVLVAIFENLSDFISQCTFGAVK